MTRTIDTPVTDEHVKELLGSIATPMKPNGPAMAALLASGIGVLVLGAMTTVAAASSAFGKAITLNAGVGPLSGKTTIAVAAFALSWIVGGFVLRGREVSERKFLTATFILIGLGILGTFPLFYDLFAPK